LVFVNLHKRNSLSHVRLPPFGGTILRPCCRARECAEQ
jgi:hypothetical protein